MIIALPINISLILVYSCLEVNLPDQPTCPGIAEGDDGTARYVIRSSGGVGGLLSDGESYPDSKNFILYLQMQL
jgi:hypothetical protein